MRTFIQIMALVLWLSLAFLTLFVLFTNGLDFLVLLSLLVVAILGLGIFGALGDPPRRGGPL
jgi:hypothetical protein